MPQGRRISQVFKGSSNIALNLVPVGLSLGQECNAQVQPSPTRPKPKPNQDSGERDHVPQEQTPAVHSYLAWLPQLRREVWILSAGQLLLFIGQGFTLVYATLYFVNQLGFSATQVGLALSCSGLSGMVGRFIAGNAIDSAWLGRRGTLLIASAIAGAAGICLAFADTFPLLVTGNLLMGLGLSLYWPATLAVTTDLTTPENRTEAFALTRLADNLGLGLGAVLAGQYIAMSGNFRALFISKGIAYWIFGLVIYAAIAETRQSPETLQFPESTEVEITEAEATEAETTAPVTPSIAPANHPLKKWLTALGDRTFLVYLLANIFFTVYAAQLSSTLPLFLANFVPGAVEAEAVQAGIETGASSDGSLIRGFSEQIISYLFFWHAFLKILLQLPLTRGLKQWSHVAMMTLALGFWCGGFLLIWATGIVAAHALIPIVAAFCLVALAEIIYAPAAVALVGDLAPENLRGIYFALESECWAIGYLIGPALGGWALDHGDILGNRLWLLLMLSGGAALALLIGLSKTLPERPQAGLDALDPTPPDPVESAIAP